MGLHLFGNFVADLHGGFFALKQPESHITKYRWLAAPRNYRAGRVMVSLRPALQRWLVDVRWQIT
jgi:hypothetical protein